MSGDDEFNSFANSAMYATLNTLVSEGLITEDQKEDFVNDHFCLFVTKNGGFKHWVKRFFKSSPETDLVLCVKTGTYIKDTK